MGNGSMQTINSPIELLQRINRRADAFKIMDNLLDYSFKLLPGAQLSCEVDPAFSILPHVHISRQRREYTGAA